MKKRNGERRMVSSQPGRALSVCEVEECLVLEVAVSVVSPRSLDIDVRSSVRAWVGIYFLILTSQMFCPLCVTLGCYDTIL